MITSVSKILITFIMIVEYLVEQLILNTPRCLSLSFLVITKPPSANNTGFKSVLPEKGAKPYKSATIGETLGKEPMISLHCVNYGTRNDGLDTDSVAAVEDPNLKRSTFLSFIRSENQFTVYELDLEAFIDVRSPQGGVWTRLNVGSFSTSRKKDAVGHAAA